MNAELLGQASRTPVGRAIGRFLIGPAQNARLHFRREHSRCTTFVARIQTAEPVLEKACLPFADERFGTIDPMGDLSIGLTVGEHQQDTGNASVVRSASTTLRACLKLATLRIGQDNRGAFHAPQYTTKRSFVTTH